MRNDPHIMHSLGKACLKLVGRLWKTLRLAVARSRPNSRQSWIDLSFQVASSVLIAAFPVFILFNLNRGLDVSDTGYYYNSITSYEEVRHSVTQFSIFWNLLPIPDTIWAHRVVMWLLLVLGGTAAALTTWSAVWPGIRRTLQERSVIGALGAGATCLYYFWWLPDPSYNSITLSLSLFLLAIALHTVRKLTDGRPSLGLVSVAGFLIVGLAIVRPPSALLVGVTLSTVVLAHRPALKLVWRISLAALGGMIAFVLLSSIVVEPFTTTLTRLIVGAVEGQVSEHDMASAISRLLAQAPAYRDIILSNVWTIALAAAALATTYIVKGNHRWAKTSRWISWLAVAGCLVLILEPLRVSITQLQALRLGAVSPILLLLFSVASFSILLRSVFLLRGGFNYQIGVLLGAVVLFLALLYAQIFGSGTGDLLARWTLVGVFAFLVIGLSLTPADGRFRLSPGPVLGVVALLTLQGTSWIAATQNPYRLDGALSAQSYRTEIRGGASVLYLDRRSHDFFTDLDAARTRLASLDYRPVLINLSGATPIIAYHLDMKLPGTPWVIGGYYWSQDHFENLLDQLPPEELCRAWVLTAPESRRAVDLAPLLERGLEIDTEYELVTTAYAPYPGATLQLFAPNGTANHCETFEPRAAAR